MTPSGGDAVNGVVIFEGRLGGLLSYSGSQFSSSFEFIFGLIVSLLSLVDILRIRLCI